MKYSVKKERLEADLKWLEEKNNALNDYGLLVRHLVNEVDEIKQLLIQRVSKNEAVTLYETCQKGKLIMCKCKSNQDCKEQSEVTYYCECDNQVGKKDVSGTLYCINCELDIKQ